MPIKTELTWFTPEERTPTDGQHIQIAFFIPHNGVIYFTDNYYSDEFGYIYDRSEPYLYRSEEVIAWTSLSNVEGLLEWYEQQNNS